MYNKDMERLRHALKVKFGLPPDRPKHEELLLILEDISTYPYDQRTDQKWAEIVYRRVTFEGKYAYHGLDYSDLNQLHMQIINLLQGGR